MKKVALIAVALTVYAFGFGQKGEKVIAKVVYATTYSKNGKTITNDSCELDISKSYSYFYSLTQINVSSEIEKKIRESRATHVPFNISSSLTRRNANCLRFILLKTNTDTSTYIIEQLNGQSFAYKKDSLRNGKWILSRDTQLINGVICYKANLDDNQYKVTAWYSPIIPISTGPLFYGGLPGLILKVESDAGWKSEMLSFTNINEPIEENIKGYPFEVVSRSELEKAKKAYKERLLSGQMVGDAGVSIHKQQ
jgi:GLPGLI family protein